MSKYLSAGVYNERLAGSASLPSPGVGTGTLVVIGYFPDGPEQSDDYVSSWMEFDTKYGGLDAGSDNGFAVKGFFDNGGKKVIPYRIASDDAAAATAKMDAGSTGNTVASILFKGDKYNGSVLSVTANADYATHFDLLLTDADGNELESFENVSFILTEAGTPEYVLNKVNANAQYLTFTVGTVTPSVGDKVFAGGENGAALSNSSITDAIVSGCQLDKAADDNLILVAPDFNNVVVLNALIAYAEGRDDCFVIGTPGATDDTVAEAKTFISTVTRSSKVAVYWPYVKIYDSIRQINRVLAPTGHIAGIYNRTDSTRNVGKNPAGVVDGAIAGIVDLAFVPTQADRDALYGARINPLIKSNATGIAVWGCRTLSLDPDYLYVNAERLTQYLEKKYNLALQWVVFENNTDTTELRAYSQISGDLLSLNSDGYFAGSNPKESFFVICDRTNNTENSKANGDFVIDIGVAISKPSEFVRIRIRQKSLSANS